MTPEIEDEIEEPGFVNRLPRVHLGVKVIVAGAAYFACFMFLVSVIFPTLLEYDTLGAVGTYRRVWEKIYGGPGNGEGDGVIPTEDGGFLVVGFSGTDPDPAIDYANVYVLKIDEEGEKVWEKTYGRGSADSVIAADDGAYLVMGDKDDDTFLMKIDQQGNPIWMNTYPTENLSYATGIVSAGDGGCIIVGCTSDRYELNYDMFAWKIGPEGNKAWEKTYGGAGGDWGHGIVRTRDGNFILAGVTGSHGSAGYNICLLKIDGAGNILWEKTIDTAYPEYGWNFKLSRIVQGSDEGFLVSGWTGYRGEGRLDVLLTRVDDEGNMVWQRTYGTPGDERAFDVAASPDGGFMVAAYHKPEPPGPEESPVGRREADVYLFKIDAQGEATWDHKYGGSYDDYALCITCDHDGGFLIAGASAHQADYGPDSQEDDLYLIRLSPIYSESSKTTDNFTEAQNTSSQGEVSPPEEPDEIQEPEHNQTVVPAPGPVVVAEGWDPELGLVEAGYALVFTTAEGISVVYSSDGLQWGDPTPVARASQTGVGAKASLTTRQDGTYFMVYATAIDQGGFEIPKLFAIMSTNGTGWSEPTPLRSSKTIPYFHQILGMSLVETQDGELVLAFAADFLGPRGEVYGYRGQDYGTDRTEVFIMKSGSGEDWSPPVLLNNTAGKPIRGAGSMSLLEREGTFTLVHTDLAAAPKWLNNTGVYVAVGNSSGWVDQQIVGRYLAPYSMGTSMARLENGTTIVAFDSNSWIYLISTDDLRQWREPVRLLEGMSPSVLPLDDDSFMLAYVQDGAIRTLWMRGLYEIPPTGDESG